MNAIERAVPAPQIEVVVQGRARRQVLRDRPPLAARTQNIHQAVNDFAQVDRPLIAAALGRRNMQRDQRPFLISQVRGLAQEATVIAGTVFGRPHRWRLPTESGRLP